MIEGSCHCGAVKWAFNGPLESTTACNCTVCRRYGTLWAYGYEGEEIEVAGPTKVYTRGKRPNLGFHFCPNCGCVASWRGTSVGEDGRQRIAVNLRLVNDPDQISAHRPLRRSRQVRRPAARRQVCEGYVVLTRRQTISNSAGDWRDAEVSSAAPPLRHVPARPWRWIGLGGADGRGIGFANCDNLARQVERAGGSVAA